MSTIQLLGRTLYLYCSRWPDQGFKYHFHCFCRDIKHILCPPMINTPLTELEFGTWEASFYCYDVSGRLLGENAAIRCHPSIEWKKTKFSGNRQGKPYNHSAFKQIVDEWKHIVSDTAEIRSAYLGCVNKKDEPLNLADLYYISRIATSHPAFLIRKKSPSITPHSVPMRLAALFKVMAGIHMTVIHMLGHHELSAEELLSNDIDIEELYSYIERHYIFEVPSGHVCGGPKKMVIELIKLLIHGNQSNSSDQLSETYGDLSPLVKYGISCARIDMAFMLNDCVKMELLLPWLEKNSSILDAPDMKEILPYHIMPERVVSIDKAIATLDLLLQYSSGYTIERFPLVRESVSENTVMDAYHHHDQKLKSYFSHLITTVFLALNQQQKEKVRLDIVYKRSKMGILLTKMKAFF
ncbi:MAG: hypothetical protein ACRBBR_04150 [Cellvibrionaceae bacterium]